MTIQTEPIARELERVLIMTELKQYALAAVHLAVASIMLDRNKQLLLKKHEEAERQ